ncbi:hypothetical protein [Streptomyces sp. NPDC048436]|uniref:hypothetical protein n=1 Tax=Streptomyces sp. NPDC048436 TaxID=3365550 RepID=UPI00371CD596
MTSLSAAHVIAQLEADHVAAGAIGLGSPALDAFYGGVIDVVAGSPDPIAAISAIAELISCERREQHACPSYRDCTETGPHFDHCRHNLEVTGSNGRPVLECGMVANSGENMRSIVYIRDEEFTDVVSVRAKTTELRNLLHQDDEMADRVFADGHDRLHGSTG